MNNFEKPFMEITVFDVEDVVNTSGFILDGEGFNNQVVKP